MLSVTEVLVLLDGSTAKVLEESSWNDLRRRGPKILSSLRKSKTGNAGIGSEVLEVHQRGRNGSNRL